MRTLVTLPAAATLILSAAFAVCRSAEPFPVQEPADMQPVEESIDVHMTYLFKPSYRRLKLLMRSAPTESTTAQQKGATARNPPKVS